MSPTLILYPLFAMMLLVSIVVTLLWSLRNHAIRSRKVSIKYYRDYSGDGEPEYNRVVSRHYSNLFEMPVLFYVAVMIAYVTQHVTAWMVGYAWAYVLSRYMHSYVHLTSNNVVLRFLVFLFSALILLAMWTDLLVMLLKG
ncbi:MAG: MAPEG family protein [Steroidobacter sp.]